MRCVLLAIGLWLSLFFDKAHAQDYIYGDDVVPLSEVANTLLLPSSARITTIDAFNKIRQIDSTSVYKEVSDIFGESWLIDDMLVRIVTRRVSEKSPQENLKDLQRAMTPSVPGVIGTVIVKPNMELYNDWFSEIKSINNFDVLVYYFKTRSYNKRFVIQDKAGRYKILGAIFAKKEDAPKAHQLIDTILNGLTFKE